MRMMNWTQWRNREGLRQGKPENEPSRRPYVFFRAEGFYPLELASDEEARTNAECNPGTIRVENMNGETVWPNSK